MLDLFNGGENEGQKASEPDALSDVVENGYRIPTFERMNAKVAARLKDAIKGSVKVGPGHEKGGYCPIERDWKFLLSGIIPYYANLVEKSEEELRSVLSIRCDDTFGIDCYYAPPKPGTTNHNILVSHGYLFLCSIITGAIVRRFVLTDENKPEVISDESFRSIVTKALDWFWEPQKQGKGLVIAPVDRMSLNQFRTYTALLSVQRYFTLAHELGHLADAMAPSRELKLAELIARDLKAELYLSGMSKDKIEAFVPVWLNEVKADIVGALFVTRMPKLDAEPKVTGDIGKDILCDIDPSMRATGVQLALLIQEMLLYRKGQLSTSTHPHPRHRRKLVRTWLGLEESAPSDSPADLGAELADLIQGFDFIERAA